MAASTELRKWYGHDPGRYPEFARRYRTELADVFGGRHQGHRPDGDQPAQFRERAGGRRLELSELPVLEQVLEER